VTDACVFCDIVAGRGPADVVGENERALALMDINPANEGHVLVISRAHAEDIWNLDVEDGRDVWALAMRIAHGIRGGLAPDGMTLFQANRVAGWQDVFHFHLHLVPRWDGDDLIRPWTPSAAGRDHIASVAERIRTAMA
jgi:histidine triad (HIT) family protein